MTLRLVWPAEAAQTLAHRTPRAWADLLLAELHGDDPDGTQVVLCPGMTARTRPSGIDLGVWQEWADAWRSVEARLPAGCVVERGAPFDPGAPRALLVAGTDAAESFVAALQGPPPRVDVARMRRTAHSLLLHGARLSPAVLARAAMCDEADVEILCATLDWMRERPDDAEGRTDRQLPVPGMDTKWMDRNGTLLRDVAGWDVRERLRPRSAVAHVTYLDPGYRDGGGRLHDAWTAGDVHELAYQPRTVVVVENRDCRLDFPATSGAVVVEGSGKAATWLLAGAPWLRRADHVVYWGDLDADGFEILHRFRAALAVRDAHSGRAREVTSILMDADALERFGDRGTTRDRRGRPIRRTARLLPGLTAAERTAYYAVTTQGDAAVRRIEQEKLPLSVAHALVESVITGQAVSAPTVRAGSGA